MRLALANGGSPSDVGAAVGLVAGGVVDALVVADSVDALGEGAAGVLSSVLPSGVLVVGGQAAVSDGVVAHLRVLSPGVVVERLWGATRVGTAAVAARRVLGAGGDTVRVALASGWSLADVGAAASLVAAGGADAVLYGSPDSLGDETAQLLEDYRPQRIEVVGGPAALSEQVRAEAVAAAGPQASARRLWGATRVETAARVARTAAGDCVAAAVIANGWSEPDVGAAAALAAAWGDSVVLYAQSPTELGDATRQAVADIAPQGITLVGDTDALAESLRDSLPAGHGAKRALDAHQTARLALKDPPHDCTNTGGGGGGGGGTGTRGEGGTGGGQRTIVTTPPSESSLARGVLLVRGRREVGEALTADTDSIIDPDGLAGAVFSFQWQLVDEGDPVDISGANSDTYTLTDSDEGKRIQMRVHFIDDAGDEETLTGPATSRVVSAPLVLGGNINRLGGSDFSTEDRSTGFITGTHLFGYAIDTVFMHRETSPPPDSDHVGEFRLYSSTSNNDKLLRKPDDQIVSVNSPIGISGTALTFVLPRAKLSPNTTYHAVLTVGADESNGEPIGCRTALAARETNTTEGFFEVVERSYTYPDAVAFLDNSCRFVLLGNKLVSSSFVESIGYTSSPALPGNYVTGEVVEVTAGLSGAVKFEGPPPGLLLQVGNKWRVMEYVANASTTTSWVFRYTIAGNDRDSNGLHIGRSSLIGYADADLSHPGLYHDRSRRVNADG